MSAIEWSFLDRLAWFYPYVFCVILFYLTYRWRSKILHQLQITSKHYNLPIFRKFKIAFALIAFLLTILAFLGPKWGKDKQLNRSEGLDICFALDLSRSMNAQDTPPSRLEYIKNQLSIYLSRQAQDRVSLIGFAGGAFVVSPLTTDLNAVQNFVDPIDTEYVSNQSSTTLSMGISTCLETFSIDDKTEFDDIIENSAKVVVLLTDGENSEEPDIDQVIKRADELHIPIFSFSVGSNIGAQIPIKNVYGQHIGYVKDPSTGANAITKTDTRLLNKVAAATGGKVYNGNQGNEVWQDFHKDLSNFKRSSQEADYLVSLKHQFVIFAIMAFILGLIGFLLPEAAKRNFCILLALSLSAAFPLTANADKYKNPILVFKNNRANAYFKSKDFEEANKLFENNLEYDSEDLKIRFNWASNILYNEFRKSLDGDTKAGPETEEVIKEFISIYEDSNDYKLKKSTYYQIAQALELLKDIKGALLFYYKSLQEKAWNELDQKSWVNIMRLLDPPPPPKKGGKGGEGDPNGKPQDGDGKDGKKPKDPNGKKQAPKYDGTDLDKDKMDEIMQSVTTEEKKVRKKKAQEEAKKRAQESRQGKANGDQQKW